ncbi:type II/IV secretion system ATPase subunit [Methanoplanus endosymbiosus]|uniref:Type II/IV secretion system ATPase subunit n=1 Tax=Methanoplanus endosymbiosus TaxID=33865 RepID=A0A9E7PP35_9EURY|nr:type II/IV secretion system ATPase subunit [Methanoplanus endosymbiosus]UUX93829.1 type II/IV secretion system ATPase subunit [Methanoplanus endosymbiosus]
MAFKWFKKEKKNSEKKEEDIKLSDLLSRTSGKADVKEVSGSDPKNSEGITETPDYDLSESATEGEKTGNSPEGVGSPEMFEFENLSESAGYDAVEIPSSSPAPSDPVWPVITGKPVDSGKSSGTISGSDTEESVISTESPETSISPEIPESDAEEFSESSPEPVVEGDSDVSAAVPAAVLPAGSYPEMVPDPVSGASVSSVEPSVSPPSESSPEPVVEGDSDVSAPAADALPSDVTSPESLPDPVSVAAAEPSGIDDGSPSDNADAVPAGEPPESSSEIPSEEITPVIREENPAEAAVFIPGGKKTLSVPEIAPEDLGMEKDAVKGKKISFGGFFGRKKMSDHKKSLLSTQEGEKPAKKGLLSGIGVSKSEPVRFYNPETDEPLLDAKIPEGYEEIESYWIQEGMSKVIIAKNLVSGLNEYLLFEPWLTEFERELIERLYEDMRDVLILTDDDLLKERDVVLMEKKADLLKEYRVVLEDKALFKLQYYLIRNFLGWSKLEPLIKDPNIEDISCDGADIPIFLYHRRYHNVKTNLRFEEEMLYSLAITLAQRSGKHISVSQPMLDATMPDGSRLQLTLGKEVTSRGTSFTIRKFREVPFTPVELIELNTFSIDELVYFWLGIENNKSLLFVGGTASGKTTSLNAVSLFIPPIAKIVSIEDTREITLYHDNWIASVTRESVSESNASKIDMFDLLKAAMRQRPEYILVGEVRGMEAQTLFQAMNTGHTTFSTLHANNVDAAIHRLENPPLNVPRNMVQALDVVSIQSLIYRGQDRVRRSMEIVEIIGIDASTGSMRVNTVFEYDPITDQHNYKGRSQVYSHIMEVRGWSNQEMSEEVEKRIRILDAMHDQGMRDYISFTRVVQSYAINPGKVLENLADLKKALI